MIVKVEINASRLDIQCAAGVLNNIYNGRCNMRKNDADARRKATSFEDETFAGLALANTIIGLVNKEAKDAV